LWLARWLWGLWLRAFCSEFELCLWNLLEFKFGGEWVRVFCVYIFTMRVVVVELYISHEGYSLRTQIELLKSFSSTSLVIPVSTLRIE
jgi:hypothetical protein